MTEPWSLCQKIFFYLEIILFCSTWSLTKLSWYTSLLLFNHSSCFLKFILTPSLASLVKGSLKLWLSHIRNTAFLCGCSLNLCLKKRFPYFWFLRPLKYSSPQFLAFMEFSPSFTRVRPLFLQFTHAIVYPMVKPKVGKNYFFRDS